MEVSHSHLLKRAQNAGPFPKLNERAFVHSDTFAFFH